MTVYHQEKGHITAWASSSNYAVSYLNSSTIMMVMNNVTTPTSPSAYADLSYPNIHFKFGQNIVCLDVELHKGWTGFNISRHKCRPHFVGVSRVRNCNVKHE